MGDGFLNLGKAPLASGCLRAGGMAGRGAQCPDFDLTCPEIYGRLSCVVNTRAESRHPRDTSRGGGISLLLFSSQGWLVRIAPAESSILLPRICSAAQFAISRQQHPCHSDLACRRTKAHPNKQANCRAPCSPARSQMIEQHSSESTLQSVRSACGHWSQFWSKCKRVCRLSLFISAAMHVITLPHSRT